MYKVQVIAKKKKLRKKPTKNKKPKELLKKPKQTVRLCMSVGKGGVLGQLYRYM